VRLSVVLALIGRLLRLFSLAFVPPLALALVDREAGVALHFAVALVASVGIGSVLARISGKPGLLHRSEALAVVAGTWLVVAHFAAVPFVLAGLGVVDAVFESMSGFTTTGATILVDFSRYGRAFFLWRAMTQWFGGLGVIALFILVLPQLGIAGRQLFFAEASVASEAVSPQIQSNARKLWAVYAALTAAQTVGLIATGMAPYDSVLHSLTTLSAGGFSPHQQSLAGYRNPAAEWVCVAFMILAGTSFTLQWRVFTGRPIAFLRDGEFRFYLGCSVAGALVVAVLLSGGRPGWDELRAGAFQSASLISSTGFASADYDRWSDGSKAVLVLAMLVGGCAGSAAGGAKAIRYLVVLKALWREITQVIHPYGVLPLRHGHRTIPPTVLRAIFVLVGLYILGYLLVGVGVVLTGTDLVTGFSASLACLGNIGPGFSGVGPMQSYASLAPAAKVLLTVAMWVGRLEIVTVLALLHPDVWRHPRWRSGARANAGTPIR
jgi:trk system potassium uptake protein